jgi:hypothetical protein
VCGALRSVSTSTWRFNFVRAMDSSLYHPGEDPQRTMYRIFFWLSVIFNSCLFLAGIAAAYLSYAATWTPLPLVVLSFLSILNVGFYGDWAMNRNVKDHTYYFLVLQYLLSGFTLYVSSYSIVQVDQVSRTGLVFRVTVVTGVFVSQGKSFIAEHWPTLSTLVIPFTTQLGEKRLFETVQTITAYVAWGAVGSSLGQIQRAFDLLDEKFNRIALTPMRVIAPQCFMLFFFSLVTCFTGSSAVLVSTFGHGNDESALLFTIVTALFCIVACVVALIAAWTLGTHHTAYTITWLIFAVVSLFAIVGGSVLSAQATEVEDFVYPRWDQLKAFLPEQYQYQAPAKYVQDAETLLRGTGLGGVMIGLFGLLLTYSTCHSAFLLTALAPSVPAGPEAIHHATTSLRGFRTGPDGESVVSNGSMARFSAGGGYYGAFEEGGPEASGAKEGSLEDVQIVDSDDEDRPEGFQGAPAMSPAITGAGVERGRSVSGVELPFKGSARSSVTGYSTTTRTAMPEPTYVMPSWGEYTQISINLLNRELRSRRLCLFGVLGLLVLGAIAIAVGLVELGVAAQCGALARGEAFSNSIEIAFPAMPGMTVNLTNLFPGGRLTLDTYDMETHGRSNVTIKITTWSLDKTHVWSTARLNQSVSYLTSTWDPFLKGYLYVDVTPDMPVGQAQRACDVADVYITMPYSAPTIGGTTMQVGKPVSFTGPTAVTVLRELADHVQAIAGLSPRTRPPANKPRKFDMFMSGAEPLKGALTKDYVRREAARREQVLAEAALRPAEAYDEFVERFEDPTAVPSLPVMYHFLDKRLAGYGKHGAGPRMGQAPLRIGAAYEDKGIYLPASDSWAHDVSREHRRRLAEFRQQTLERFGTLGRVGEAQLLSEAQAWYDIMEAHSVAASRLDAAQSRFWALKRAQATSELPEATEELGAAQRAVDEVQAAMALLGASAANSQVTTIITGQAMVNISSSILSFPPEFARLSISSDSGAVLLNQLSSNPPDSDPEATVKVNSVSGAVRVDTMLTRGIEVASGGNIFLRAAVAIHIDLSSPVLATVQGNVVAEATGSGTITVTQGLGGYSTSMTTHGGELLVTNCAGAVYQDLTFQSNGGDIWFNTMLMAAGNHTNAKLTGGTIHVNVMYGNNLFIDATEGGTTAGLELFLGLTTPTAVPSMPEMVGNYTFPGIRSVNPKGPITVTGIGAAPATDADAPGGNYPSYMQVYLETMDDPINVQINGGGINGPYHSYSLHGQITVEVNGDVAPAEGVFGTVDAKNPGEARMTLSSNYGDINLVQLDNSIPDLGGLSFG